MLHDMDVSRETLDRLESFAKLTRHWTRSINLVAPSSLDDFWVRHILDSAQLFDLAPASARVWADLGSGAGFPGLVVAILAREKRPDLRVELVESDRRKAVFLRTAAREAGVLVKVHAQRIEALKPLRADVVSARALASLDGLMDHARHHLVHGGVALFPKGVQWRDEVKTALARHRFRCEDFPSRTAADAVVLRIGDISRV